MERIKGTGRWSRREDREYWALCQEFWFGRSKKSCGECGWRIFKEFDCVEKEEKRGRGKNKRNGGKLRLWFRSIQGWIECHSKEWYGKDWGDLW